MQIAPLAVTPRCASRPAPGKACHVPVAPEIQKPRLHAMVSPHSALVSRCPGLHFSSSGHIQEAEFGLMQPPAKESPEPPEGGRGKEGFTPRSFGGNTALPTPWLWTSCFQNCTRIASCYFRSPNVWSFVMVALGNQHSRHLVCLLSE